MASIHEFSSRREASQLRRTLKTILVTLGQYAIGSPQWRRVVTAFIQRGGLGDA